MPLLFLALGLLLGAGFVWLLFAAARHGHPHIDLRADGMTFRHGPLLRVFAVGSLLGAEAAFGLWAALNPDRARVYAGPLIATAAALGLAGFLLCWEAFRFAVTASPAGLDCRSPWAARRFVRWSDVTRVEFSPANSWFAVRSADGRAFRVPVVVPGMWRFLAECEKHLKPEQLRPAEPGYRWVGRRWPFPPAPPARPRSRWRWARRAAVLVVVLAAAAAALFVLNGLVLAAGETPVAGQVNGAAGAAAAAAPGQVRVVAYNVAKGFAPRGGLRFADRAEVEDRLRKMAAVIRSQNPDLVFLSEVMTECGPCPVNQVEFLARECGLPFYVFGENYNFGLPFYRVVGGNAILGRRRITPEANVPLAGRRPFYVTHNNRRALFASLDLGGRRVWLGSVHNDSFDPANNAAQVRQLLAFTVERPPCLLAGDFNATPEQESIRLLKESGRFVGEFAGPPTYPADAPDRRIDYIFGPAGWTHVRTTVLDGDASDHRAVAAVFRIEEP